MKTTVEIPDALLSRLKAKASKEKTTLRELIRAALTQFLRTQAEAKKPFKLKDCAVGGSGFAPGLEKDGVIDWRKIREIAYEGRGGFPEDPA